MVGSVRLLATGVRLRGREVEEDEELLRSAPTVPVSCPARTWLLPNW